MLGVGIVSASVRNPVDPALALLMEDVSSGPLVKRIGAILGLGMSYAHTKREEVTDLLSPVLSDADADIDLVGSTIDPV